VSTRNDENQLINVNQAQTESSTDSGDRVKRLAQAVLDRNTNPQASDTALTIMTALMGNQNLDRDVVRDGYVPSPMPACRGTGSVPESKRRQRT
jgi:hypothetical protein